MKVRERMATDKKPLAIPIKVDFVKGTICRVALPTRHKLSRQFFIAVKIWLGTEGVTIV